MPSIDKRLTKVEDALITHLTESGEIRQSIRSLHEAIEKLANRMWGAVVLSISTLLAVVGFLLRKSLWG